VNDLKRHGIALAHIHELLPESDLVEQQIAYAQGRESLGKIGRKKSFLKYLMPEEAARIEKSNPFIELILHPTILDIVASYLNFYPQLKFISLNTTLPVPSGSAPVASQRWHRDPGLSKNCKIFVYASDVDEGAGPFTYALGSHQSGRYGGLFPTRFFGREGRYIDAADFEAKIPGTAVRSCTGKRGTIIFCDTLGIHRGGYATTHPRTMFTAHFESAAAFEKPRFRISPELLASEAELSSAVRHALNL